jgi:GDP-D-mannose dehydratase
MKKAFITGINGQDGTFWPSDIKTNKFIYI